MKIEPPLSYFCTFLSLSWWVEKSKCQQDSNWCWSSCTFAEPSLISAFRISISVCMQRPARKYLPMNVWIWMNQWMNTHLHAKNTPVYFTYSFRGRNLKTSSENTILRQAEAARGWRQHNVMIKKNCRAVMKQYPWYQGSLASEWVRAKLPRVVQCVMNFRLLMLHQWWSILLHGQRGLIWTLIKSYDPSRKFTIRAATCQICHWVFC